MTSNIGMSVIEMKLLTVHEVISLTDVFCDINYLQHLKVRVLFIIVIVWTQYVVLKYHKFIVSLICSARIDFSEQYHIEGETWIVRCNEKSISRENISTIVYLLRNWQSDICASDVNTNNIMLEINDNMFLYNTNFSLRMSIYRCTPEYGSCRCFYFNR
jgi:hypothetical protein